MKIWMKVLVNQIDYKSKFAECTWKSQEKKRLIIKYQVFYDNNRLLKIISKKRIELGIYSPPSKDAIRYKNIKISYDKAESRVDILD